MLPHFLRRKKHTIWLYVLLRPIGDVVEWFNIFKEKARWAIAYNGQTLVLELALNDKWPDALGGIYIENQVPQSLVTYFYINNELPQVGYLYQSSEDYITYVFDSNAMPPWDFIVWVPAALTYNEEQMRAYVNQYKIAGKRFKILTY